MYTDMTRKTNLWQKSECTSVSSVQNDCLSKLDNWSPLTGRHLAREVIETSSKRHFFLVIRAFQWFATRFGLLLKTLMLSLFNPFSKWGETLSSLIKTTTNIITGLVVQSIQNNTLRCPGTLWRPCIIYMHEREKSLWLRLKEFSA